MSYRASNVTEGESIRTGFGGSSVKHSTETEELLITYLGLYNSLAPNVSCRDAATW